MHEHDFEVKQTYEADHSGLKISEYKRTTVKRCKTCNKEVIEIKKEFSASTPDWFEG